MLSLESSFENPDAKYKIRSTRFNKYQNPIIQSKLSHQINDLKPVSLRHQTVLNKDRSFRLLPTNQSLYNSYIMVI